MVGEVWNTSPDPGSAGVGQPVCWLGDPG